MNSIRRRLACLLVLFGFPLPLVAQEWRDGRLGATGVRLDRDSNIVIGEAGDFDTAGGWLTQLLKENLLLILGKDRLAGPGDRVEFVLETEAARWQDLPPESRERLTQMDSFSIDIRSVPMPRITIRGKTPVATGYGVLCFLEEELGMHWAFPGELGRCPPKSSSFLLVERTIEREPAVMGRALSGLLLSEDAVVDRRSLRDGGVLMENREFFLASDYFKSLRMRSGSVTHNMLHIFPAESSITDHPEILPKRADGSAYVPPLRSRDGRGEKRSSAWHPCYTNPKTLEIAVARGREELEAGRLFYSLGINDGRCVQCQCDQCLRVGWPDSYYQFVAQVAEQLAQDYPAQFVGVLAYGDVGIPPRDLRLPPNVLVNIAGARKEAWTGKTPHLGVYEYLYGAGFVIPNLPLDVLQENFAYYAKDRLALFRAEFYPVWAFDAPKAYIVRRMLWDPNHNVRALLREYCDRTFGDGGQAMYDYYDHAASWRAGDAKPGQWAPYWGKIWPFRDPLQFERCPPDYHAALFAHLDRAKRADLNEAERKRLEMVETFTRFSATCYQMWRLKERVFLGKPTVEDLDRARDLRAELAAVLAQLRQHPEWFLGSSVKAAGLRGREWPTAALEQQMLSVECTARQFGGGREGTTPACLADPPMLVALRRQEHPWYKPWQSQTIVVQSHVPAGFSFHSRANETIHNNDDPRYNGQYKFQWLHATGRDIAPRPDCLLVAIVEVQGRGGMLQLELESMARDLNLRKRMIGQTVLEFGASIEAKRFRVAFDPSWPGSDVAKSSLQLRLLWKPVQPEAMLRGTAVLRAMQAGK